MSVLVRGMEMPNSCIDCDFCGGMISPDGIYFCDCPPEVSHGKNISENIENNNKPDFCPLVEVPAPHGDLIDRDALNIGEYEREDDDSGMLLINISGLLDVYNKIKDAPPVIAAEVSE